MNNVDGIFSAQLGVRINASIIDTFNEAGVEIASPHLRQLRDGNDAWLPEDYLPKDFRPGGFRLFPGD